MNRLLIYSDFVTERLIYTFNFICLERQVDIKFCNDPTRFIKEENCAKLVYADYPFEEKFPTIKPAKIIFEDGISEQDLAKQRFENQECLSFGQVIDPVASVFFVVSRYEEYLPFTADEHERFSSVHSVLKKMNWLYEPIADIWAEQVLRLVQKTYPEFVYVQPMAHFTLSFDVDNTFAFKHKNSVQLLGGRVKDFIKGNQANLELRRNVLSGRVPDPNDTFDQILNIAISGISMKLFWHLGDFKKNDRNISWNNAIHQRLIQKVSNLVDVGIHPSYFSYLNEVVVKQERGRLEHIIKRPVFNSRQHFLRIRFPNTFQLLHNISIKHDYSVGFADDIGFRMGTARAVPFFNLVTDEITDLILHPFVYMDGTLNQYLKLSPEEAQKIVNGLTDQVKMHGGNFICIWHNDTINDLGVWEGWKAVLEFTIDQFRIK